MCIRDSDYSSNDHFYAMHRAMRYVIDTKHHVLTLIPDNEFKNVIMGFSDSNYATDKDRRRSISGFAIYYNGALVSWKSKMQQCVTLSSTEAEYVALSETTAEVMFVKQVLQFMEKIVKMPIEVNVDNVGAIYLVNNESMSLRTKHVDTRYHFVREFVADGKVIVVLSLIHI